MLEKPRVLVLCTANRCRSQMAEGWLRHFAGHGIEVHSAGTTPRSVHPKAIEVMREAGLDISDHRSKSLDQFQQQHFDYVVTVCDSAREACPVFPNAKQTVHEPFPDPDKAEGDQQQVMAVFRDVRDQIRDWAHQFVKSVQQNRAATQQPGNESNHSIRRC
jgi:arsenate reductase